MQIRNRLTTFLGLTAISLSMTGCGVDLNTALAASKLLTASAAATGSATVNARLMDGQRQGRGQLGRPEQGPGMPEPMLAGLTLTDDQKAQLQAIAEKYKPVPPSARPSDDPNAAVQAAVLADTVDDAALRGALATREAAAPPADDHVAMLVAIRAVLTDDQRAQLVAQLQAGPAAPPSDDAGKAPRPERRDDVATMDFRGQAGSMSFQGKADFKGGQRPEGRPSDAPQGTPPGGAPKEPMADLALTDAQQANLDAFQAALKPDAADKPQDPAAGMIAFWQTGDTSGLAAPARKAFPVDAFVTLVESLDLTQRQALFARGDMLAGPHGPEGFGGPGRDGHGPHGPAPEASPAA